MAKDISGMSYKELAKFQNMSVARTKAIEIMEKTCPELEGEDWYLMEDEIENIISSN